MYHVFFPLSSSHQTHGYYLLGILKKRRREVVVAVGWREGEEEDRGRGFGGLKREREKERENNK